MLRSCWACWEEKEPPALTAFAPTSALPSLVRELAAPEEVRPVLCATCLLAGVNLSRTEAQRGER